MRILTAAGISAALLVSACDGGRSDFDATPRDTAQRASGCSLDNGEFVAEWTGTIGVAVLGTDVSGAEQIDQFNLPADCDYASVSVDISWDTPAGTDLDVQVTAPDGSAAAAETGASGGESVVLTGPVPGGEYSVRVWGYNSVDTSFSGRLVAVASAADGGAGNDVAGVVGADAEALAGSGKAADDVVVIAVIDSGLNPYHWDFLAEKMPQHNNTTPVDDLPLDRDPAEWIAGHPGAAAFASYERLDLSVAEAGLSAGAKPSELHDKDAAQWGRIRYSEGTTNADVNMYWMPGTKVIGHVAFSGAFGVVEPTTSHAVDGLIGRSTGPVDTFATESHGIGSASVSVGNIHGSCPSCVLVYVHGPSEWANEWVASQDWIDLQTNSWGLSLTGAAVRDNIYAGSDTNAQREAVERGQSWFQSAGNGLANAFTVPSTTLLSSQKGPDWIVTVGAIEPEGSSVGHNRPVDLSSVGAGYPSATGGGDSVTAEGNFSGTSNATPVISGIYGEALYRVRRYLDGPSRVQKDGVVARGPAGCAAAVPDCPLADGELTVHELQQALFENAQYSAGGTTLLYQIGGPDIPDSENTAELEFVSEGHGSYYGRLLGDENYYTDISNIVDTVRGVRETQLSAEQEAWLVADSLCRQSIWGSWDHGYYDGTNLPDLDPEWPIRMFLSDGCPLTLPLAVEALLLYSDATAPLDP